MRKEFDNFLWSWSIYIILYEQERIEHQINPLEFEAHKQEWEKINSGLVFSQRNLDQEFHKIQ
jgi:hypothetical protein